jgi:hypothetical protein
MQSLTLENTSEVLSRRLPLIGVHECEEGLADEIVGLFLKMPGEYRVEVDELEVGGEQGPIYKRRT